MKKIVITIYFFFLTMTILAQQPKGYATLDYSYEFHSEQFNSYKLIGKVKSLLVYEKENENFHDKSLVDQLDTRLDNCQKWVINSDQISEYTFFYTDGTLRSKQVFSNRILQERVFYQQNGMIKDKHIFIYNDFGQLLEKFIKNGNNEIVFDIKYNYDKKNRIESVIGDEIYDYKYIYDDSNGFYEVKYIEHNGLSNIREVRYNKYSDSEILNIILQNDSEIKFDEVRDLKKSWQQWSRLDIQNRVIFEQSFDFKSNEIEIERSFTYNDENLLIGETFKTKFGTDDIYTFVYKNNKLIRKFAKNKDGFENFNKFLYYNNQGDLVREENKGFGVKEEIYEYEYIYDKIGNWTEKKEIVNERLFKIIYRQIEYED